VREVQQGNYRGGATTTHLRDRSRQLRRDSTDAERVLWRLLRDRRLAGKKFRRQHEFGPYILDFFCAARSLAIEIDGEQHLTPEGLRKDEARTRYVAAQGVHLVRFNNVEVLQQQEAVLQAILLQLKVGLPSP
jgi:very-short-patch-repair endonuclease